MRRAIFTALLFLAALAPGSFTPGTAGLALAAEGGPGAAPPTLRIRPLMVPVISKGVVEKYTQIEVSLEIARATNLGPAQLAMPKIQDALLVSIYEGIERGWIVRGNISNIPALRRSFHEVAARILGKDVVSRILITPIARQSTFP